MADDTPTEKAAEPDDITLMQQVMFQMIRRVECPICGDKSSAHPGWVTCLYEGVRQLREALPGVEAARPRLVWDDVTGYYCPACRVVVARPKRAEPPVCPACPHPVPVDERVFYALREAGFDEADAETAARVALEAVRG